jgi:predicted phage terminase large subunit-like protein
MFYEMTARILAIGFLQDYCGSWMDDVSDLTPAEFWWGCREAPHWFVPYVLGFENSSLHDELQWHLSDNDNAYCELPRGHGKTNQMAGRVCWEIGRDPHIRVKIVGSSDDEATKTVTLIRKIVQSQEFRNVFPDVEPDKDSSWGNTAFTVKRSRFMRDPTVEAVSVFGRAGGRSDLLIPDDICDLRNSVQQPSMREQVKDAWTTIWLPTLDRSGARPRIWKFGTPYHVADITADWREYHRDRGGMFRRPVVGHASPWPEVYTRDMMVDLRAQYGPIAYARAYELSPVSSDQLVFDHWWLDRSLYEGDVPEFVRMTGQSIAATDFAFSDKTVRKGDPDYSVLVTGYRSMDGFCYVDKVIRARVPFPEWQRICARECRQSAVSVLMAEGNGPQAGLVQQLSIACDSTTVVPLVRTKDKLSRASEKQGFVEQGRLRLRGDKGRVCREHSVLYEEMTTFPAGDHDDAVDAVVDLMEACMRSGYGHGDMPALSSSGRNRLWRLYG